MRSTGYSLMKLCISRQDLQDFISTRLDLMKNTSTSESASKVNPKLGVKFAWGPIGDKTNLVPFKYIYIYISFPIYYFHPKFWLHPFWKNWGPVHPVWGTLWITLIELFKKSSCLCALVYPCNPSFIPNFRATIKWAKLI